MFSLNANSSALVAVIVEPTTAEDAELETYLRASLPEYSLPRPFVDTIPTCQLKEGHVSMGGGAANKLAAVMDNVEYILAIELITSAGM